MGHVAGYTIGIDLSARDWQKHPKHLVKFDLFGGKAFDNSNPLGPRIVPAPFLDPSDLELTLKVNGDIRQHAQTSQMIWSIAEQIEAITQHVTLEPGDILMTGTPSGVGLSTGTYLKVGDRIDAEIEGLGCLTVEIAEPVPLEQRTYELQVGKVAEYLALYQREGLAVQTKHLTRLIGYSSLK
jgi:2-keto-4-pentenoate hydratase/2-oxohepta-3-ene-1,7-dioic acid hydratase in catechol pathway